MASITHERARVANAIRHHPDDHEAIDAARRDLAAAKLEAHILSAPPLTPEQAARLRALLPAPSAGDGNAA
jgi:hypothetical protein